jgi:hypothetical protein
MNSKEFTIWLKGFLVGKNSIDSDELLLLNKELDNVVEEVKLYQPPYMTPKTDPYKPPFTNPTCETGKQLLNDTNLGAEKMLRSKFKGEFND